MTIKERLEVIILDKTLSKYERSMKMAELCKEFLRDTDLGMEEAFDWWNNTVADIVIEHNLGAVH